MKTILTVSTTNLETKENKDFTFVCSNEFISMLKYEKHIAKKNLWVNGWEHETAVAHSGNQGMNAGAYLNEFMEQF